MRRPILLTGLTAGARSMVVRAHDGALRDHADVIREEHLLEAVLADDEARHLLGEGLDDAVSGQVRSELAVSRRKGGVTASEEAALAALGIDLEVVVAQIERHLGAHTLAPEPDRGRGRHRTGFSAEVARIVSEAGRHASASRSRSLDIEHVVLALVSTPGALADSLARRGVDESGVRATRSSPMGRRGEAG
ncbi:MAG: Clp protease N-terminal domain-containing protein [Lapillicoccus sp.]